ncbi:hypothetical protein GT037_008788 [Alternaria burnsii]|uniref:Transcription initiation factor TFIID subunit 12 domain-containing protein n=1 Tax=Alternaria burnsii TaxID=1187904 RepID=A0A8H7B1A8_9PLEO|nr:uncharacterized protein GT037_008788 [Alternaria burnsii]KAF7673465.1 hypothetical protein GT037_008788 [Alternaria burnsii]
MASQAAAPPSSIRILSLNCWGLKFISKLRNERLTEIGVQIAAANPQPDIVGLQECWTQQDYHAIREKTRHILPYGKFYHSGIFGGGLVILSRWPIVESNMVRYPLNGRPAAFYRGDWFVGKGVACARIQMGPSKRDIAEVFCTHLHAPYEREPHDSYICHRTAQAWEITKLMRAAAERGHLVIGMGDFNMIPLSLAHRIIETHSPVQDVWRILHPDSSIGAAKDKVEQVRGVPMPSAQYNMTVNGATCDSELNSWRWNKAQQRRLTKGENVQIDPTVPDPNAKRLDYVFFSSGRYHNPETKEETAEWTLKEANVGMEMRHPTLHCSLSDHFSVEATLTRTSTAPSAIRLTPWALPERYLPIETYDEIMATILKYQVRERIQRKLRIGHFFYQLSFSIGCLIGVWWSPKNYVSFILMLLSTLGFSVGVIDGLIGLLFVGSEMRALKEFEWEVRNTRERALAKNETRKTDSENRGIHFASERYNYATHYLRFPVPNLVYDTTTVQRAARKSAALDMSDSQPQQTSGGQQQGQQLLRPDDILKLQCLPEDEKQKYRLIMQNFWTIFNNNPQGSQENTNARQKLTEWSQKFIGRERQYRAKMKQQQQQQQQQGNQNQGQAGQSSAAGQQNANAVKQEGGQAQPQGSGAQANQQAQGQQQPNQGQNPGRGQVDPAIVKHVHDFPMQGPTNGPTPGTPEYENKLKEYRTGYLNMLAKQATLTEQRRRIIQELTERQNNGQELPQERLLMKNNIEKEAAKIKAQIDKFRAMQKQWKEEREQNSQGQAQAQGQNPAQSPPQQQPQQQQQQQQQQQLPQQQPQPPQRQPSQPNMPAQPQVKEEPQIKIEGGQAPQPQPQTQSQPQPQFNMQANQGNLQQGPPQQQQMQHNQQLPQQQQMQQQQARPPPAPHSQTMPPNQMPQFSQQGQQQQNFHQQQQQQQRPQINPMQANAHQQSNSPHPQSAASNAPGPPVPLSHQAAVSAANRSYTDPQRTNTPMQQGGQGGNFGSREREQLNNPKMPIPRHLNAVLQLADDFVDNVISNACKLSKLRDSPQLDIRDIQVILERNYNIRIPGYASDEVRTVRKIVPAQGWANKMSAVNAAKVMGGKADF